MTLSNTFFMIEAFRSRPDRRTDLCGPDVHAARRSGVLTTCEPTLCALDEHDANQSYQSQAVTSEWVEEARRLLKKPCLKKKKEPARAESALRGTLRPH